MPNAAVYANCFAESPADEVLVTAEEMVASAWPGRARVVEAGEDPAAAHAATLAAWDLSFRWFRSGEHDPTVVEGVSAGDLAAIEMAQTVFLPAARGVLEARAVAADPPDRLTLLTARGGPGTYLRYETIQAESFAVASGAAEVRRETSTHPRNGDLFRKYARTRDPEWLVGTVRGARRAQQAAHALLNMPLRLRRRLPAIYVLEYNPTRVLAEQLSLAADGSFRLVRGEPSPRDVLRIARAGDRLGKPVLMDERRAPQPSLDVFAERLELAGADVWPVVEPFARRLLDRYARYSAAVVPRLLAELERADVRAVIVPFDGPPRSRVLVRVAQSLGIQTFVINDGYKADEVQREGFAADVALAWSAGVAENYFARRGATTVVTGNPRAASPKPLREPGSGPLRILIGGFAFSPVDLNCGRSDPARFSREVLAGIAAAFPPGDVDVRMKLHPADDPAHHRPATDAHAVTVIDSGDVGVLFEAADLFLTMYSTSLLEAANAGVPIVYYAVNEQRFFAPFEGDPWLAARTARTPEQLAALLKDRELWAQPPPEGWLEHYLGPRDGGSTGRILQAVRESSALR